MTIFTRLVTGQIGAITYLTSHALRRYLCGWRDRLVVYGFFLVGSVGFAMPTLIGGEPGASSMTFPRISPPCISPGIGLRLTIMRIVLGGTLGAARWPVIM